MARIGCLGNIVFSVSAQAVKTISDVQWSGVARYAQHQRHLSGTLTEFTGLDPEKISLKIELSSYLGVDPMGEISKLRKYERAGKALPLVIGEESIGKHRWTIKDYKVTMQQFDRHGNIAVATVSLNLLEYLKS